MDFRFDDSEQEILSQAAATFQKHLVLPASRSDSADVCAEGWRAVATDGWLSICVPAGDGEPPLPLAMVAGIGREAGRVLSGDTFVDACVILAPILEVLALSSDRDLLSLSPGFLVAEGRSRDLYWPEGGNCAPMCFGVQPGLSAYGISPDGTVVRYPPEAIQFEPVGGLSPSVGFVRFVSGVSPEQLGVAALDRRVLDQAMVVHAASLVGLAEKALADTVEYVKVRDQFGGPIGRFQAIKHGLADVAVANNVAWDAVMYAALITTPQSVAIARIQAVFAAELASRTMTQFFGGIAMTWEHHAHWVVKTTQTSKLRFESPRVFAHELAAELIGALTS